MPLMQVRVCDGVCCKESPRFPNESGDDCIYRTNPDPAKGCALRNWTDEELDSLPVSPAIPTQSGKQTFLDTCKNWLPSKGKEGGCCWQWIDD